MMKCIKRVALFPLMVAVLLVSIAIAPAGAVTYTLEEIINNDYEITVGDKLFHDFSFSLNTSVPLSYPTNSAQLTVTDTWVDGNAGLRFGGSMYAGSNALVDFIIGYHVSVLDPSQQISDIHLAFNGAVGGEFVNNVWQGGFANVTETIRTAPGGTILAQVAVSNPTPIDLQDPPVEFGDNYILSAGSVSTAYVEKDVMLIGGNGFASISWVDQAVSQTAVPEPTTVMLLGSGLIALGLFGRRMKKA